MRSADRLLVIAEVGLVGRAHLDELHAGGGHDLGQAKGAADLDQLAAGDDHFLAGGHGIEHDRRGGGVVVDHRGGLGAGEQPRRSSSIRPSRRERSPVGHVDLQAARSRPTRRRSVARPAGAARPGLDRCGG